MPLSVRLTSQEDALLEQACRRLSRCKSDVVRLAIRELAQQLARPAPTPYLLGAALFGAGKLAIEPKDPHQRALKKKVRGKHRRLG